jgi:hypothetical protein
LAEEVEKFQVNCLDRFLNRLVVTADKDILYCLSGNMARKARAGDTVCALN